MYYIYHSIKRQAHARSTIKQPPYAIIINFQYHFYSLFKIINKVERHIGLYVCFSTIDFNLCTHRLVGLNEENLKKGYK